MSWQPLPWLQRRRARALLAADLGPVPWCLRMPPPRALSLVSRQGQPLDHPLLQRGHAVRGVVLRSKRIEDREGPDFDVTVAFPLPAPPGDDGPPLAALRWRGGWDAYHWAMGSPEHHAWFHDTMARVGAPVTLLVEGEEVVVAGMLEAFEPVDLATILARADDSPEPARSEWLTVGIDLLIRVANREPDRLAAALGPLARSFSDSPDPADWPRALAGRLRRGQPVAPLLARMAPLLPDVTVPVWVAE